MCEICKSLKSYWSPFDETEYHLSNYEYFFPLSEVSEVFGDHPQIFEDWLKEHCPDNYCYVWVWDNSNKISIVGNLVGVPEELAMPLKLMTGIDPVPSNVYVIKQRYRNDYKMYATSNWEEYSEI